MVNNGQNWVNVVKERPNIPIVIELTFSDSCINIPYYCQTTEFNLLLKPRDLLLENLIVDQKSKKKSYRFFI